MLMRTAKDSKQNESAEVKQSARSTQEKHISFEAGCELEQDESRVRMT